MLSIKCDICKKSGKVSYKSRYSQEQKKAITFCEDCEMGSNVSRRGLTDHERLKLSWYRDEKKWIENIQSRKVVEKNGQKMVVSNQGLMPRQPAQFYKNGGHVTK